MKLKIIFYILLSLNLIAINLSLAAEEEKIFFNKGLSFEKDGRWGEAINEFNNALRLNPRSAESYYHIGVIYEYQLKYYEAINFFQKASDVDSKYAFYAGLDWENLEKWDEAISAFKTVLSVYPEFINARFHLGFSYKKKKMFTEAISEFKKILEQDQNHAGSIYNLAIIYKDLGMMSEAKKEASKFNQLTSSNWSP